MPAHDVAQDAAAHPGDAAEQDEAENVHALARGDERAGHGEHRRAEPVDRGQERVEHRSPSCPALCRASTTCILSRRKTWMAGSSPAMTKTTGVPHAGRHGANEAAIGPRHPD